MRQDPSARQSSERGLLRLADQIALGLVVGISLLVIVAAFVVGFLRQGEYIQIDRAQRKEIVFQVDLNQANWPELALLPGVGELLARKIVAYRTEHGPFTSVDELVNISGLGATKVENLRPFVVAIQTEEPELPDGWEVGVVQSNSVEDE
jgi:competence ComEA-like helix-hairpin-helix protein